MKKMMSMLLSLLMLLCTSASMAEDTTNIETLIGRITEMREDGGFLMRTLDKGQMVQITVDENTMQEAAWEIGYGDVVTVVYNGRMTRSMPPQAHAQAIRSYSVEGPVTEVDAPLNRLLIDGLDVGEVWMILPEEKDAAAYAGRTVRVFFSGIMALSMPAQAHAIEIDTIFTETGTVESIDDGYFLLKRGADLDVLRVNFDAHTKVIDSFDEGDDVQILYNGIMTMSLPGQITATIIAKTK